MDGSLKVNDSIVSISTGQNYTVRTLGMLTPHEIPIQVRILCKKLCQKVYINTLKAVA